jgi:hypothetical protein
MILDIVHDARAHTARQSLAPRRPSVTITRLIGIRRWEISPADYSARVILSDGSRSPKLDLRPIFE